MSTLDDLREPFDRKFIEQVGPRKDDYVNHAVVTDRLNRVLGLGWSFSVDQVHTSPDGTAVLAVTGTMRVQNPDGYGLMTERTEVGMNERHTNFGDDLKTAVSDCIKRCAMRYGVAIQLWHKQLEPWTSPGSHITHSTQETAGVIRGGSEGTPATSSGAAAGMGKAGAAPATVGGGSGGAPVSPSDPPPPKKQRSADAPPPGWEGMWEG